MNFNQDKVDEYTLALLHLVSYEDSYGMRAWKGFDWETLDRLHEKGFISNPKNKAKSVSLSPEGEKVMKALFDQYFGERPSSSEKAPEAS